MIERLFAVRHGETEDNVNGIAQGWTDSPLTEKGLEQVRAVAERVCRIEPTSIWSSPLLRASETARIIAGEMGLEAKMLEDLREVHCGVWEGQSFIQVRETDREYYEKWRSDPSIPCPEGESLEDVRRRIRSAVDTISASPDCGERPLIVSHATSIKVLATVLLDLPLSVTARLVKANTGISTFNRHNGEYYLLRWNDHSHWS